MSIRQYVPISVGVFVLACGLAHLAEVPIAPIAIIILVAETIIGLQLEDEKLWTVLKGVLEALLHPQPPAHGHH